jgi:hypothetical protein
LEAVFLEYHNRRIENEAFDLDARIALLEAEVSLESGRAATGPKGDREA